MAREPDLGGAGLKFESSKPWQDDKKRASSMPKYTAGCTYQGPYSLGTMSLGKSGNRKQQDSNPSSLAPVQERQVAGLFSIDTSVSIKAEDVKRMDALEDSIKAFFLRLSSDMAGIDNLDLTNLGYEVLGLGLRVFALEGEDDADTMKGGADTPSQSSCLSSRTSSSGSVSSSSSGSRSLSRSSSSEYDEKGNPNYAKDHDGEDDDSEFECSQSSSCQSSSLSDNDSEISDMSPVKETVQKKRSYVTRTKRQGSSPDKRMKTSEKPVVLVEETSDEENEARAKKILPRVGMNNDKHVQRAQLSQSVVSATSDNKDNNKARSSQKQTLSRSPSVVSETSDEEEEDVDQGQSSASGSDQEEEEKEEDGHEEEEEEEEEGNKEDGRDKDDKGESEDDESEIDVADKEITAVSHQPLPQGNKRGVNSVKETSSRRSKQKYSQYADSDSISKAPLPCPPLKRQKSFSSVKQLKFDKCDEGMEEEDED